MKDLCNINQSGINLRKFMGIIAMGAAIIGSVIYIAFEMSFLYLVVLFLVFFVAFFEILQAKVRFCYIFGMSGFDNSQGEMKKVSGSLVNEYKSFSVKILKISLVLTITFTAFVYLFDFVAEKIIELS